MTNKTKHHVKKHFCLYFLQCFSSSKISECHVRNFLVISHIKSVLLPEEGEYVNFQNLERLIEARFIIYDDFEYFLMHSTNNILVQILKNIKIILFAVICVDDRYSKPYKTYFGEDAIDKF